MKTRVNILFWARAKGGQDKTSPSHAVHIVCRLTVRGEEVNFATGLETQKSNWQAGGTHGRVKGKTPADRHINIQLTKLADELTDIHADLERQKKPVTARAIYRLYKNDGCTISLLELFAAFIEERSSLVGLEISQSSHNLADKFCHWALQEKGNGRTYINKMLSVFNQLLRWGVRREYLEKNPMEGYKYKPAAPKEIKYLTVGELAHLTAAAMPARLVEHARDCFTFQCWTGLAYADLAALDMRSAEYRLNGQGVMRRLLRVRRQKSTIGHSYECIIPLLPEAERILAKHRVIAPNA